VLACGPSALRLLRSALSALRSGMGKRRGRSWCSGFSPSVFRCLRAKPVLNFSPPAQAARGKSLSKAPPARSPRWGSPKEEVTLSPSKRGIAPCSPPTRPARGSYLAVLASRYAGLSGVCARCGEEVSDGGRGANVALACRVALGLFRALCLHALGARWRLGPFRL